MPRYYFHLEAGHDRMDDEEGMELPDLEAVKTEASKSSRYIINEILAEGGSPEGYAFIVEDEDGSPVLAFLFKDSTSH